MARLIGIAILALVLYFILSMVVGFVSFFVNPVFWGVIALAIFLAFKVGGK